ncbi:MAG: hypothetical protein HC830_07295 [Bacteroidetes bacterium]|nr:hypothetical protein [Bacteroidota bacterium]
MLVTNPFLAGLDEIQYLRKLSEESRVIFQIAGGFNYNPYISGFINKTGYLAELKHSCNCEPGLCNNTRYLEVLLQDSAVLLSLMRGTAKRISINSWDCKGLNPDLLSARIELDNGNIANLLITQGEKENKLNLELYSNDGISRTSIALTQDNQGKMLEDSISLELAHFYTRIHNPFSNSNQHDMMFQALEIAHTIRAKVIRHYAVNAQN